MTARIRELYVRNPFSKEVVKAIHELAPKALKKVGASIKIMDFCGTHEWTITYYGLRSLMPKGVELIAGPGCPVCITPGHYVDALVKLSLEGINVMTYGDSYMLPGRVGTYPRNLAEAKALGGSVTVVYSFYDALKIAKEKKNAEHVFFAVGFETTMPAVADPITAKAVPGNLKILCAHRFTVPVVKYLLEKVRDVPIKGVIAPGHVSAIIGWEPWRFLPEDYGIPTVVSGFEPLDVLLTIFEVIKQVHEGKPRLVNEYRRVVRRYGNEKALKAINEAFNIVDSYWRGIGIVRRSGAVIKERYSNLDAEKEYGIKVKADFTDVLPGCKCGEVVLGKAKPTDCPLFMKACTPEHPYGPCMVSSEGTCKIWAENFPVIKSAEKLKYI